MDYIESAAGWLLSNWKGDESRLFTKQFKDLEPNVLVQCPDIGPTGSNMPTKYYYYDKGEFPSLEWSVPADLESRIKEWVLIAEDPSGPLSTPVVHALFYGITKTNINHSDIEVVDAKASGRDKYLLKGGFIYGVNELKSVYIPPRGLLKHGAHKYVYQVIGLSEPLDRSKLSDYATKAQITAEIQGKVVAYGDWTGIWERR